MLSTFNDEDIIREVIEHLIKQGLDLVIFDDGSKDKTFQICKEFSNENSVFAYQQKPISWDMKLVSRILYDLAISKSPDWVVRTSSDEFLETGISDLFLKNGIDEADKQGYNLIQFNRFDFFMTSKDDLNANSIKKKIRFYSYQGDNIYRAWKFVPGISVDGTDHYPIFPEYMKYKISPKKFVLRHYPYQSITQARKKLTDRKEKITESGWGVHKQYERTSSSFQAIKADYKILSEYKEDGIWNLNKNYCPFISEVKSREEIFSPEGKLIKRPLKNEQLREKLKQKNEKITELKKKLVKIREKNQN